MQDLLVGANNFQRQKGTFVEEMVRGKIEGT